MKNPKVSAIIPIYNKEKYLEKCLISVLGQTLKDIEIICINDGSSDSSADILKKYWDIDARIKVFSHPNTGAGYSRNRGIEESSGEYLMFLDADDFFEPNLFERAYEKAKQYSDVDVVVCPSDEYCDVTKTRTLRYCSLKTNLLNGKEVFSRYDMPQNILNFTTPEVWGKLIRREFVCKNSLKFQNIKTCNDMAFSLLALAKADKVTYIKEPLIHWRTNAQNTITSTRYKHTNSWICAYRFIKNELIQANLFDELGDSFYKVFASSLKYEKSFCRGIYLLIFNLQVLFNLSYSERKCVSKSLKQKITGTFNFLFLKF